MAGREAAAIRMRRGRLAGLTGVLLACASAQALAQTPVHVRSRPPPPPAVAVAAPPTDDGLAGDGFYLEADSLTQNDATHHVVAAGGVEARYKGRVLRADSVDYDSRSGIVIARGNVQILEADGTAQFADTLTLDKTMSTGFAAGFSSRLRGDVKIAAASARRQSGDVTQLDRVIYTPCPVCVDAGRGRPTWSIRAKQVTEDKRRKTLTFHGAVIQVKGVGVLYLPIMQTADPTADRKSGLLLPVVTFSGKRGFSYEQPYYQVISPSQDFTVTPQINSKVNPFLNIDWRRRFYSGVVDVRAGYTYDQDFTSGGDKFGALTSRSYILASGAFQLSPAWQWGFTAEQASDRLIFDKYAIGDVFVDRGLYAADDRRLISQVYAVRQDSLSYLSVAAISVQGLRDTDVQSTFPIIAPLVEARWEPAQSILGGRLRLDASAVVLTRDQSTAVSVPAGSPQIPGIDSRRATVQADWQRTFTLAGGLRLQPFIDGRADVYDVSNPAVTPSDATITRAFGTVGANISYPLIKQSAAVTWVLEPLAQVAISPNTHLDPRIPNEDSVDFEFDETNLFQVNRSPGFDLYEGGQSITLGGRVTGILPDGRSGSVLFGRRFAAESDPAIPERTGLETALSDYIFGADVTPIAGVRVFSRLRLDSNTFAINRLETGAAFNTGRIAGYVSYLQEAQTPTGGKLRSLDVHGEAFVTKHWGVTAYGIVDNGAWLRRDLGVVYRDDCVRVEVLYRHDETVNGTLGPSTSVVLRLTLATLGNSGYSR
jgi:LPS-assembly protein